MALITTTGSFIRQYNAFTGLSALQRSQSGIARAEVAYYNVNDNWPAAGAGNSRMYQTGQIDLPKDFGYVITDGYVRVSGPTGGIDTETVGALRIFPGGILGPQINVDLHAYASRQDSVGVTPIGDILAASYNTNRPTFSDTGAINYVLTDKPTALIYPFGSSTYTTTPNPASVWEFALGEQLTGASQDYDVSCYFRFLQYDIDQSYNYVLQSPQLTR